MIYAVGCTNGLNMDVGVFYLNWWITESLNYDLVELVEFVM